MSSGVEGEIMDNIIEVQFNEMLQRTRSIWQYDYGQVLKILSGGVVLPNCLEVHFSLSRKNEKCITRIGTTVNGVTEVQIPNELLNTENKTHDYFIYAFIYVSTEKYGNTKCEIIIPVKSRIKPENPSEEPLPEPNIFHETVVAVNASAERAKMAEQSAKASATEAGKYAASASDSAVAVEKTKEDALRKVGEKKQEAIEAIQNQEETSVGKITTHTDGEIQRIQNQATESKGELEQTITNAGVSKEELDESIQTASDTKTALDKSVELAGTAKTELDTSIREAGTAKTALDESTETAGTVQETLSATVNQAGALDTSLGEEIETGTQLKTDLVASGEKAVQDIQAVGSEQLGKMQAVAEAFTADREQIATNKKDIGSLKEELVALESKKISQLDLTENMRDLFEVSYNLINDIDWLTGKAIRYDGTVMDASRYRYCEYPVTNGQVYKVKCSALWSNAGWIILDENKKVVTTDGNQGSNLQLDEIIKIPLNGKYLCFNDFNSSFIYCAIADYALAKQKVDFEYLPDELKSNFTFKFNDITDSLIWVNGGYIQTNGKLVSSTDHYYAEIKVSPNTEFKITGAHSWSIACYVVKNALGNVVLTDDGKDGVITKYENASFIIPSDGCKLYVNKYGFSNLQVKNKLSLIIPDGDQLEGKTIVFNGDSIMAAAIDNGDGTYGERYGWAEMLRNNNEGLYIKNYGQGGTTIAKKEGRTNSILERVATMFSDFPNADGVIIEGGVNDCYGKIDLGTISDGYNATFDEYTFCGALESLFKQARLNWKDKFIGYIITFKVPTADPNFINYMDKAREICEKWGIAYIDLYKESKTCFHLEEMSKLYSYGAGGLHPNIEGYKLDYPMIENWIKEHF